MITRGSIRYRSNTDPKTMSVLPVVVLFSIGWFDLHYGIDSTD
jgi:hypothetical protein